MYYCIVCKRIHEIVENEDKVFKSGFKRLLDGTDVQLGICAKSKTETPSVDDDSQ